ncbi:VOC family protein [Rhodococcus globerulus]|uniref:VOC family protein n=1 Tax=Rhodococcus globerulus TaxID=33008 RepID=A0ABU4C3R0_RHOGO|nr:VOC family protein [Rhodococcus globerulus]MDV6271139.1 VOC family protein [Rhodococcus globerulus]
MAVNVKFHHIGITVSNLERTLEFFENAFGIVTGMALRVKSGNDTAEALGLPEHEQRVALLAAGDVIFELIEFHPARRESYDGRQDDVGYAYPCFAVEDIDAAYDEWTRLGYKINARPQVTESGPVAGSKFMVLKDPDGKNIEIVETGKYLVAENIRAGEATASLDNPVIIGKH